MDKGLLALFIQEGSKILSDVIRNRAILFPAAEEVDSGLSSEPIEITQETAHTETQTESKATAIATGCIPCSLGHIGTCSGLLNEAMRFARSDGVGSDEVIERVNMCLDELNSLERVDLRPEMIQDLVPWEKKLAQDALNLSRSLRHDLEGIADIDTLEKVAADTQTKRQEIGRSWFKQRLELMTPAQREQVKTALEQRAKERANNGETEETAEMGS